MPYVVIDSTPANAEIWIAGQQSGVTPKELLIENPTTIELRKEGYISQTETVSGTKANVMITLEEVPPPPPPVIEEDTNMVEEIVVTSVEPVEPVAPATNGMNLWVIIAIIAIPIALVLFLLNRKKK